MTEVVDTPALRSRGLSGRESLTQQTGMLFVFQTGRASTFWMKEMMFALDFVWIGVDCTVVDTTLDVPPPEPGTPTSALPLYSSADPAAYTFEINAGEVVRHGIEVGDEVRFSRISSEGANC